MNEDLKDYSVDPVTKNEKWMQNKWRPAMGWTYMIICLFDFVIAPTGRMLFTLYAQIEFIPWESLTLSNGGLFHMAMAGIIGAAAWTRGQEKIKRIDSWGTDFRYDKNNPDGNHPSDQVPDGWMQETTTESIEPTDRPVTGN